MILYKEITWYKETITPDFYTKEGPITKEGSTTKESPTTKEGPTTEQSTEI